MARILDGKALAQTIREEIAKDVAKFNQETGKTPHLAAIIIGDDPASQVYVRNKRRACEKAGMESTLHQLPAATTREEAIEVLDACNNDPKINGILLQLPIPDHLDADEMIERIDPFKDVDGLHPISIGLLCSGNPRFIPCTPYGVQQMLIREGIETSGKNVVIVGRSHLVGRPLSILLSTQMEGGNATVTVCHSRTSNLDEHLKSADIVVAAIGRPKMIHGSQLKPGCSVIDVGINRLDDGSLVGDVDFESASEVVESITPVPGGVGPMTIAMLLKNTLTAARLQSK